MRINQLLFLTIVLFLNLSCGNKKITHDSINKSYQLASENEKELSNLTYDKSSISSTKGNNNANRSIDVWMEGEWVVSIGECSEINTSKELAMGKALESARSKAIQYAAGINISSATLLFNNDKLDKFTDYTYVNSFGRIVQERSPTWQEIDIGKDPNGLTIRSYKVTLKCKVEKETGNPDPGFSVDIKPNKMQFKNGDIIQITVIPTIDCYLTILNVYETDDKVMIIFPNDFDSNNKIKANQARKIPLESSGIAYRALLPEGKDISHELIWVLATKDYVNFAAGLDKKSPFTYLATPQAAMLDIMKKLVIIPLNKRTQSSTIIQIEK